MTELRLVVPDDVATRLDAEAAERGVSTESLAADVLTAHVPSRSAAGTAPLSFIAIGHSGQHDLSERVKEIRQASFGA